MTKQCHKCSEGEEISSNINDDDDGDDDDDDDDDNRCEEDTK